MAGADLSLPDGYRLKVFDKLDSTNNEALRLASAGEASGLWVWAHTQEAGRGRSGRSWESLPGNLCCSLLLRLQCPASITPQLGFVTGVALHGTITRSLGNTTPADIRLKWPNDILIDDCKAGGILLESQLKPGDQTAVVIGVGINVAAHPETPGIPATSLHEKGSQATPRDILETFAGELDTWLKTWNNGSGFAVIREAWLKRAHVPGTPISVKLPKETLSGTFAGIDDQGALIMILPDGQKKLVTAGDVFPL